MTYFTFTMEHLDEGDAPPTMPVLHVGVVGNAVVLDICKYEETNTVRTLTRLETVTVHAGDLMALLTAAVAAGGDDPE